MNNREKVLYNLFPDFKKLADDREYHRRKYFDNHNEINERIKQFSEKLSEMDMVKKGDVISNFSFNNNRFYIYCLNIEIVGVTNKFIKFKTHDNNPDIHVKPKNRYNDYTTTEESRINKIDFYTTLLHREDYKHILRDFFIDQLI